MGDFSNLTMNTAAGAGTGNIPLMIPSDKKAKDQWGLVAKAMEGINQNGLPAGTLPPPGTYANAQPPQIGPTQQQIAAQSPAPVAVAAPAPAPAAQPVAQPAQPPAAQPAAQPPAAPAAPAAPAGSMVGSLGSDVSKGGGRRPRGLRNLLTGLGGAVETLGA